LAPETPSSLGDGLRGRRGGSQRLEAFDAVRGLAMIMVWLSHFMGVYFANAPFGWSAYVGTATLVASPTFMALSGIMLGMLTTRGDQRARDLRLKLADRALFLLLGGHVVLVLATASWPLTNPARWLGPAFITDTIGVSILASLWLVPRIDAPVRIALGIAAFTVSWLLVVGWHPVAVTDIRLKEILFGSLAYRFFAFSWAVVPWLSLYLACTGFGEMFGALYRAGRKRVAERVVLCVSATSSCAGAALHAAGRRYHVAAGAHASWYLPSMLSRIQKWPPSPAYLLFFGGAGMGLLWAMLYAERVGWARGLVGEFARLGRCSLALFLAQAFVYYRAFAALPLRYTPAWPLLFVATAVPLCFVARLWDQRQWNRLLTVGLPRVLERAGWAGRAPAFADGGVARAAEGRGGG
jgi:hypothetical protein